MAFSRSVVWLLLAGGVVTAAPIETDRIYVVDSVNNLLSVDPQTGATTRIGPTAAQFTDIAIDARHGHLFGVTSTYLYRIDHETGWSTLVGRHRFGDPGFSYGIDSLAFDQHGTLYGAGNDVLISMDPSTGTGTRVGSLSGFHSAGDLTVDDRGRLLLSTDEGVLVEVHRNGSGATPIGELPFIDVYSLATLPSGEVLGIRGNNRLLRVDPATGRATSIAVLSSDELIGRAWGAAAIGPPMPEPASLVLLVSGAAALGRRRCDENR